MEAVVAILRPKHAFAPAIGGEFIPSLYEILLMETQISDRSNVRNMKLLPTTNILTADDPSESLFAFLYRLIASDLGDGLKGKKEIVHVPAMKSDKSKEKQSDVKASLFCITIDVEDTLNHEYTSSPLTLPQFYPLDVILDTLNAQNGPYFTQTKVMLLRLRSWLIEKQSISNVFEIPFSTSSEQRLAQGPVTNPVYVDDNCSDLMTTIDADYRSDTMVTSLSDFVAKSIAATAVASSLGSPAGAARLSSGSDLFNMPSVPSLSSRVVNDKCEITKINPLFGSELPYKCKVDRVVINKYYGLGKPDFSKLGAAKNTVKQQHAEPDRLAFHSDTAKREVLAGLIWKCNDYPLHQCAMIGDAEGIKQLIMEGWTVMQRDAKSATPIHYAAYHGHVNAITVLLNESNCSPNVTNDNGSTPLHLAASQGKIYVVELLLTHQDIDVCALDKFDKTALDYCESVDKPDWQSCATLLRVTMSQPTPTIQVSLMDGSFRVLNLVSKINTTVQQLHRQMMKELKLPEGCSHLFTIWICSKNLQLQLKPEHKPIQHLNDWKRRIVLMLTDQDPINEDPQLFWKRDAILSIEEEKRVKNPVAINLLYLEAYHNYIKSLYPCAETDATILAGILMYLYHGEFDVAKTQPYRTNEQLLTALIPSSMLRTKNSSSNWLRSVVDQYKHYSRNMAQREKTSVVLQMHFLTICWNLTAYGSAFFTGYVRIRGNRSLKPVYIGVNDVGLHIITVDTRSMWRSFAYHDIEWQLVKRADEWAMLEIKVKNLSRQGSCLHTKQAGLIEHLMNKLSQLNSVEVNNS